MSIALVTSLKRPSRRRWEGCGQIEHPRKTLTLFEILIWLLALLCMATRTSAASAALPFYYGSCFRQLHDVDVDRNLLLSKAEFNKFILALTGGAVVLNGGNNDPAFITFPFSNRRNETTASIDITGTDFTSLTTTAAQIADAESFCQGIYRGLFSVFQISVSTVACVGALQVADTNPKNGSIAEIEYPALIVALTGNTSFGDSYGQLPQTVQDAFLDLAIDGEIRGPQGTDYLVKFCNRVKLAVKMDATAKAELSTSTIAPTSTAAISASAFSRCHTALIVSDLNRDDQLGKDEFATFVNRLSNSSVQAIDYSSLDSIFQDIYVELSGTNNSTIDISGSKPGLTPTEQELFNLKLICSASYQTIERYQAASQGPSPSPGSVVETPAGSDQSYTTCTTSMIMSDLSHDNLLQQTEFVRFLSRLTTADLLGLTFNDLDPMLQQAYNNVTTADGIDINGAKPSESPTAALLEHLRAVCSVATKALAEWKTNGPSVRSPVATSSPSAAPTIGNDYGMPNDFLTQCKTAILIADNNRDEAMSQDEYVRFLNRLTFSRFSGFTFVDLDVVFQASFSILSNGSPTVDISGSKPGTTTTAVELDHLRTVCVAAYYAIKQFNTTSSTASEGTTTNMTAKSDCIPSLYEADVNHDNALDENEYLGFLKIFADATSENITDLPYLLQDNYQWINLGKRTVNVKGSSPYTKPSSNELLRLNWICNRTISILDAVAAGGDNVTFTGLCKTSMLAADENSDSFLNKNEFLALIYALTFEEGDNGYNFDSMDAAFRSIFNNTKDASSGLFEIERALSAGVCEELGAAIEQTRAVEVFFQICKISLTHADNDQNDLLDQNEYVLFLYDLATLYDITNSSSEGIHFGEINPLLQLNYEMLSLKNDVIDVKSGLNSTPTEEQIKNLQWICNSTENVIDLVSSDQNITVTVYNSFVIGNAVGLTASDLSAGGNVRHGLGEAYTAFAEDQVAGASKLTNFRNRRLAVFGIVPSFALLYRIEDADCPAEKVNVNSCQTVFSAFDVKVSSDTNAETISSSYTGRIQDAIDAGDFQLKLLTVAPDNPLKILKSSLPVRPTGDGPAFSVPTHTPTATGNDKKNGTMIMSIVIGAVIGVALFGVCYCYFFYKKREDCSKPERNKDDEDCSTSLDENMRSMPYFDRETNVHGNIFHESSDDDEEIGLKTALVPEQHPGGLFNSSFNIKDATAIGNRTTFEENVEACFVAISGQHSDYTMNRVKDAPMETGEGEISRMDLGGNETIKNGCNWSTASLSSSSNTSANSLSSLSLEEKAAEESDFGNFVVVDRVDCDGFHGFDNSEGARMKKVLSDDHSRGFFGEIQGQSRSSSHSERKGSENDLFDDDPSCPDKSDKESGTRDILISEIQPDEALTMTVDCSKTESQNCQAVKPPADEEVTASGNNSPRVSLSNEDDATESQPEQILENTDDTMANASKNRANIKPVADDEVNCCLYSSDIEANDAWLQCDHSLESIIQNRTSVQPSEKNEKSYGMDDEIHDDIQSEGSHQGDGNLLNVDRGISEIEEEMSASSYEEEEISASSYQEEEVSVSSNQEETDALMDSTASVDSSDLRESYEKYRPVIEELVRQVVPNEIDNIDDMMEQFIGREHELITTLKNMAGMDCDESDADDAISDNGASDDQSNDDSGEVDGEEGEDASIDSNKDGIESAETVESGEDASCGVKAGGDFVDDEVDDDDKDDASIESGKEATESSESEESDEEDASSSAEAAERKGDAIDHEVDDEAKEEASIDSGEDGTVSPETDDSDEEDASSSSEAAESKDDSGEDEGDDVEDASIDSGTRGAESAETDESDEDASSSSEAEESDEDSGGEDDDESDAEDASIDSRKNTAEKEADDESDADDESSCSESEESNEDSENEAADASDADEESSCSESEESNEDSEEVDEDDSDDDDAKSGSSQDEGGDIDDESESESE